MSILYHDVGILRARAAHADTSAKFIEKESDVYIDPAFSEFDSKRWF
jgi:hypothetical protein